MSISVGICRCEKIRDRAGLRARDSHNRRLKPVPNAEASRTRLNRNLRPDLPAEVLASFDARYAALGQPRLRKNGVLGLEYVLTFSPAAAESIDPDQWATECLRFIETRHGAANILSAHLHRDEKTPHVHIVAMPEFAGTLAVGPFMGNRSALVRLQNDFHKHVSSKFELARTSDSPSGRKHISPAALRAESSPKHAAFTAAMAAIDQTAIVSEIKLTIPEVAPTSLLTLKGRDTFSSAVCAAAKTEVHRIVTSVCSEAKRLVTDAHKIASESLLLREENARLRATRANVLRDLDLAQVAEHILGFDGCREGISLVWENDLHKLVITASKFKDFKYPQRCLGGGSIDLVMHLLQCPYAQAISVLAGMSSEGVAGAIASYHRSRVHLDTLQARATARKLTFSDQLRRYASADAAKLGDVRNYLINTRNISSDVVDRVIESGDLWANKWASCVFAHRARDGVVRGCSIRSTAGSFKQSIGDKISSWFSVGSPLNSASTIAVAESPIDALSLAEIDQFSPGKAYVSTSGQLRPDPLFAFEKPLELGQDSDDAGDAMAAEFEAFALRAGIRTTRRRPPDAKDWNELLIHKKNEQRRTIGDIEERERQARERERAAQCRAECQAGPMAIAPGSSDPRVGGQQYRAQIA